MKTTIEISDGLLLEAKRLAQEEGTTLRELIESSLRSTLEHRRKKRAPFKLERCSFKGKGLQPGIREGDWSAIRDLAYEGRGG
jgi:hypothetical protein